MTSTDLFKKLEEHLGNNLPFVAYKKPDQKTIKVIFQYDDALIEVSTFKEIGFVFAPFEKGKKRVLIPGKPQEIPIDFTPKTTDFSPNLPISTENGQKHILLVEKAIAEIKTTALKKVVLSRKQTASTENDSLQLFKALINTYPAAFAYIFYHPKIGTWLGATPETLVQVDGLRFKTMALAGTQAYLETEKVSWGNKEIDEQQLVVDDIFRNLEALNLKNLKISERETVRAGNLLHLRSVISGVLQGFGQNLEEILNALHPTPAVCGLPRELAASFIMENEGYDRKFYTGFLGELNQEEENFRSKNRRNTENLAYKSIKKSTALYVNLRCMQYVDKQVHIYVGGGITRDSLPQKEWEETVAKAQTMLRVLSKS